MGGTRSSCVVCAYTMAAMMMTPMPGSSTLRGVPACAGLAKPGKNALNRVCYNGCVDQKIVRLEILVTMPSRHMSIAAATLFVAIFTLCAVSTANATDVVWKKAGNAL